jgi:hypothetical protein
VRALTAEEIVKEIDEALDRPFDRVRFRNSDDEQCQLAKTMARFRGVFEKIAASGKSDKSRAVKFFNKMRANKLIRDQQSLFD